MLTETTLKAAPVAQADRITAVDTLRGFALLGILMMNIPYFALQDNFSDAFHADTHSPNFWTEAVIDVLFEGKMRALFSMIFGAGILLFTQRKEEAGFSFKGLFFSRMGWMVVFGLIHAHLLLWIGDILYMYGMIGMLAFLFRKMKAKYLVWGVPIVAIFGFVAGTVFYQHVRGQRLAYNAAITVQKQGKPLNAEQKKAVTDWKEVEKEFLPDKAEIAKHTTSMKGSYADVGAYIRPLAWKSQTTYLFFGIGDVLALMMLGMAMYKWKFVTGGWSTKQYRLTALIGYGVGLPLVIWDFIHGMHEPTGSVAAIRYLETHTMDWWGLIYPFQRMFLVMAHASVILLILRASVWKALTNRLAAVGQMAFTNYIMHTVICTLIFFGYGLNYYNDLKYYQLYYIVGAIWLLQLIVSPLWLKYYLFGPLEWLWRSLTYRQIQPMRRERKVSTPAPDPAL